MKKLLLFLAVVLVVGLIWLFFQKPKTSSLTDIQKWNVEFPAKRLYTKNSYDVIIVGGGFGGLSCGSILTKHGYRVLLVEKNPHTGGYCQSTTKAGFTFTLGGGDVMGGVDNNPIHYLLKEVGLQESSLFIENNRKFIVNKLAFEVPTNKTFEAVLMQQFPEEQQAIFSFFEKAKSVFDESYDPNILEKWGTLVPEELFPEAMPPSFIKNYEKNHKNLLEWEGKTYQEVLDEYFEDSLLKKTLCSLLHYLGAIPIKTSAASVVRNIYGYFFFGGLHCLGSPQRFADLLENYIMTNGGDILFNETVDKILTKNGEVTGIQIGKKSYNAPIVVSNVNAKTTYLDLVQSGLSASFLSSIKQLPMGHSAIVLQLGIDQDLSKYPSLIEDRDETMNILISSNNDPTQAPPGQSCITLVEPCSYYDYMKQGKDIRGEINKLIEQAATLIPEINNHIVIMNILTPKELEELVAMPQGALYGFDIAEVSKRPYFKAPIKGLYLANASCNGAGVFRVIGGGILAAQDIMGWKGTP